MNSLQLKRKNPWVPGLWSDKIQYAREKSQQGPNKLQASPQNPHGRGTWVLCSSVHLVGTYLGFLLVVVTTGFLKQVRRVRYSQYCLLCFEWMLGTMS